MMELREVKADLEMSYLLRQRYVWPDFRVAATANNDALYRHCFVGVCNKLACRQDEGWVVLVHLGHGAETH